MSKFKKLLPKIFTKLQNHIKNPQTTKKKNPEEKIHLKQMKKRSTNNLIFIITP